MVNKTEIFEKNQPLITYIINKHFKKSNYNFEELFQDGAIGLCKAIDRYDSNKGKFGTYAYSVIYKEILTSIRERSGIFKYSNEGYSIVNYILRFNKQMSSKEIYDNYKNETNSLIDYATFSVIYQNIQGGISTNTPISNSKDGDIGSINDLISDDKNIENDCISNMQYNYIMEIVKDVCKDYSERDRYIYMKWLKSEVDNENVTFESLGKECNISKQRVNDIVKKINRRLQHLIK